MADNKHFEAPVFIHETTGADRLAEPILGGLPIARGELSGPGWFSLKASDGTEHVLEGVPAAYWPDGSTKWLHLCGQVDLAGGRRNEFVLRRAGQTPQDRLVVDNDCKCINTEGACLRVTGGALEVCVQADVQNVLTVRYGGKAMLRMPGITARLVLVGPDGQNRRILPLSLAGARPEVVVQTANRVVVRLAGRFPTGGDRDAGELVLFVEVLRQTAELRLQPVFIYLGQPEEDLVSELTLTVNTAFSGDGNRGWKEAKQQGLESVNPAADAAGGSRYGFANQRGRGYWDLVQRIRDDERGGNGPRWPQARQVQLGSSFYVTEKRTGGDSSWTKAVEGQRSQGWCCLANGDGGVTAAMRYFWQEYPHSLTVDADRGTICFGLVPPEAAPLDLRRYSRTIYGPPVYEASHGSFPLTHGATGIAKSFELMLRFDAASAQDAPQRGLAFANPCRLQAPPEYFARTKAIGHVAAADAGKHRKVEDLMARCTDFLVQERDSRGWYGLMNFGDIMCAYYAELDRWAFDDGGYAWINTEGLPDYGLWISALRSGRADWLDAAVEMTRHNRDVDMYHRGPLKGAGTRHNVNHWGCQDKEWRVSMPLVKRLHYYVTADPWTAEVIRQTVAVYQQFRRRHKIAPSFTCVFAGIMAKWEMSNDPADAKTLENFADAFARAVRPDGMFTHDLELDIATGVGGPVGDEAFISHFFMNGFGGQHALVEYAELTGCKALSDAIVKHLEYYLPDKPPNPQLDHRHRGINSVLVFLAHAYRRTGQAKYRDAIARAVAGIKVNFAEVGGEGVLDEPPHTVLPDQNRRNKVACWLGGSILHQISYGLAAMEGQ